MRSAAHFNKFYLIRIHANQIKLLSLCPFNLNAQDQSNESCGGATPNVVKGTADKTTVDGPVAGLMSNALISLPSLVLLERCPYNC